MLSSSEIRAIARNALKGKWSYALLAGLIASLFCSGGIPSISLNFTLNGKELNADIGTAISYIPKSLIIFIAVVLVIVLAASIALAVIGSAIRIGYCKFNLCLLKENRADINQLFSSFKIIGKAFLLYLLTVIYTVLWTLLFIIPGIIAAYRYALAPYLMAENPSMTAREAIKVSKSMMDGNKWRLFCLEISFIGWIILALFTCGIGFLWLTPYMEASLAVFYNSVKSEWISANSPTSNYTYPSETIQ